MVSPRRVTRPIVAIYPFGAILRVCGVRYPWVRDDKGLPPLWPYPCRRECEAQSRRSGGQAPTHQAEEDDGPAGPRHPQEAAGGRTRPRPARVAGVLRPLPGDRDPGAQRGLQGPDDVRLLQRRQAGARHLLRRPEPRLHPPLRDAAADAGRGRRRGEPDLLDRPGHRPQGHPARRVLQRPRQRPPGRVDDHPAVRQDPLPHQRAELPAQDQGSRRLAQDPERAEQGRDPRGLPQHHLLRSRRVRRAGGGAGVLRQGRRAAHPARERGARHRPQQPVALRPRRWQGGPRGPQGALHLRARGDGRHRGDHRRAGREGHQAAAEVPRHRGAEPVRRPARPHALAGQARAARHR